MADKAFIDTNVFVYLYSEDEPEKKNISQEAVDKYNCIISTQVVNEFCNVCMRKFNKTTFEIELAIKEISGQCVVNTIEKEHINQALRIHRDYGYGYFDCLILASALDSNCKYVLTEDMADGQIINNNLTIINIYKRKYSKAF
jgi:predicted nucleic acid-binding protein